MFLYTVFSTRRAIQQEIKALFSQCPAQLQNKIITKLLDVCKILSNLTTTACAFK